MTITLTTTLTTTGPAAAGRTAHPDTRKRIL
jgi:hypothetical protein